MPSIFSYKSIKAGFISASETAGYWGSSIVTPVVLACGTRAAILSAATHYGFTATATGLVAQCAAEYAGYAAFSLGVAAPVGVVGALVVGGVVKVGFNVAERSVDAYRKHSQNQSSLHNEGTDWDITEDNDPLDPGMDEADLLISSNALPYKQPSAQKSVDGSTGFYSRFFGKNKQAPVEAQAEDVLVVAVADARGG